MNEDRRDNSQLMHAVGQLTGTVQEMHRGLTTRIEDIKDEIKRIETAQREGLEQTEERLTTQIAGVEERVGKRIDGLGTRVSALEAEDKRIIKDTAKLGALGGGVGGALAAAAVELIKHFSR